MSSSASSHDPQFAPFGSSTVAAASSNSSSSRPDARPSAGADAPCYTRTAVKKKRAKQTSPTVDSTAGLDPFATVPDGEQLLEQARVAAGLEAAIDTEAPTRPMEPPVENATPDSGSSGNESGSDVDGRSTGKSNRPTSSVEAIPIDPSRGVETFGRRAHNAYMPPDPHSVPPGQWAGHGQDPGYAPAPQAWAESQPHRWSDPAPHAWADPVQPPTSWQGYPHQPPTMFVPPDAATNPGARAPHTTAQLGLKPNFAAMMCYLPYLGIVGSILMLQNEPKENRFVRFHARQSLIAHVLFWALTIAFAIAKAAAPTVAGVLIGIGSSLFHLGAVVGLVWMMVRVYKGRADKIPVIGEQVDV